ncbi:hypothetical protein [Mycolicibacterium fortuitum]|uniref:Uncharacterized protein n=1 Tax=Mycolicibacterium fortuitum TaxID=1766 RepID=A0AAE4VHA2_MYCFO|nr:hypothetical protein [Mycolicibacterium fortuitum]MDV7194765.1 hypothetical protein [Mycolicibacterium fortuitum]MDV7207668.1 hypothetical protein [Mycolicibacterium fortuitum]MDV7229724.1 hypothetical protein [Mycolicibacterium fortuitum]MDV7261523.1 hypothetical protein [Mycolicibacterium fortuitum]MDV7286697.1 hypothetical protein [Mycolicibacterium fortuitum]
MTAASEIVRRDPTSFGGGRAPATVSQATAIEQQRAIAEVQAAVVVSQNCPRDMADAEREMEYVCGRLDMAEQAFYQVTNRGTGPTVHLMRELARIWGNVDHGVKELHRNDEAGESEVQAFAWDIQKNTRSSRTFIVPHQRMVKGQRKDLVDLQDIYLNNQNIGARAVRECIGTILPRWFTEKAQNVCHETLKHGEGKPLRDRIESLIGAFDGIGVTVGQLEARIGRQRGQWTPEDVAQLTVAGQSIRRGEAQKDELFPPVAATSSTADEIAPAAPAEEKPAKARTTRTRKPKSEGKQSDPEPEPSTAEQPAEPEATEVTQQQETRTGDGDTNEAETTVEETTADPGPGAELSSGATPQADSADQEPAAEPKPKTAMRKAVENRMWGLFNGIPALVGDGKKVTDDERYEIYRQILGRPEVKSTDDLDNVEVAKVCDVLFDWAQNNKTADEINEIRNAIAIAEAAGGQ